MSETDEPARQVVKLTTSCWHDARGLHIRRSLTTLKRQSTGFQILEEECVMAGDAETVQSIVNLSTCKDGVYVVVPCNESRDHETGHIDGYDLELVPVKEQAPV